VRSPVRRLWAPWAGRGWPATGREEIVLVAALRAEGGEPTIADRPERERAAATSLLNALRAGMDVTAVRRAAPGLRPPDLVAAWDRLDTALGVATAAWVSIAAHPTTATLAAHATNAAQIAPAVVGRAHMAAHRHGDEGVAVAVMAVGRVATRLDAIALAIEAVVDAGDDADAASVTHRRQLGRALYDPHQPGLWANPSFIPGRVGTLTAARVARLWTPSSVSA